MPHIVFFLYASGNTKQIVFLLLSGRQDQNMAVHSKQAYNKEVRSTQVGRVVYMFSLYNVEMSNISASARTN